MWIEIIENENDKYLINLDKVNQKIEAVENLKSEFKEAKKKYNPNPKLVRARKTAYERKRRRKIRQREREERWHKYGIG